MSADKITIEAGGLVKITTARPVSVATVRGVTTVTIGRAPDDDAATGLADLGRDNPAEAFVAQPIKSDKPRCGMYMIRSGQLCARVQGHKGAHQNAEQVARKKDYNKRHARQRYADDPEYADRQRTRSRTAAQNRASDS